MPTFDEFMSSTPKGHHRWRNAYVTFRGFNQLYVRHSQRVFNGELVSPVVDLANIEADEPGKGTFTRLLNHIRKTYPEYWVYVESVLNPRFEKKLLALGFKKTSEALAPSFFLPPVRNDL